jgi:RES domain-containing protein
MVNTSALYHLQSAPVSGTFYRYIRTKYAHEPLSMQGAIHNGGRYNVAGLFGALYLGFDRRTCEAEVSRGIAAGLPFKQGVFTALQYAVSLEAVISLDNPAVQKQVDVTEAEITIPGNHWTARGIGEHLHKRGDVEGLIAPSAQLAGGRCLDIFLDRLQNLSSVNPSAQLGTWP